MMKIQTNCPHCDKSLKVSGELSGRKVKCPACKTPFLISPERQAPPPLPDPKTVDATYTETKSKRNGESIRRLVIAGVIALTFGVLITVVSLYFAKPISRSSPATTDQNAVAQPAVSASEVAKIQDSATPAILPIAPEVTSQLSNKTRIPKEIVFPQSRKFLHGSTFIDKKVSADVNASIVVSRADNKSMLFMADLFTENSMHNGTPPILQDTGFLRFMSYVENWNQINPAVVTILCDKREVVLKCRRDNELLIAEIYLDDYQVMICATNVEVQIDSMTVKLEARHLEAMRDLASRMPDGITAGKMFAVRHEPDAAGMSNGESSIQELEQSPAQQAILPVRNQRLLELNSKMKEIADAVASLKVATIADDKQAIATKSKTVSNLRTELGKLIDAPISSKALQPNSFRQGQVGFLEPARLKVSQVLNKEAGEMLVHTSAGRNSVAFKVVGVNATNAIDGGRYPEDPSGAFVVVGTYMYETVSGDTNTIFELHKIDPKKMFTQVELQPFREAADSESSIVLTEDEQATMNAAREANAKADIEKTQLAKTRRSKSFLDSAKPLISKGQRASARKLLEKAVAEDPDSESAKEAAKLLETLQ